jgi:alkylation response protein AidB-like acyl-CoA dehydrogenase
MDFDLTEEQSILKDSLDRLLAAHYGFEQRRAIMAAPEGFSGEMWGRYAEMGLMALPFAEEDGGIGGTAVETMLVMEAFGKVLVLEPYWPTVVLGGGLIRFGGSDAQRAALAPAVAEGALKLAFAQGERNSRYDLHHVETKAAKNGAGWRISGRKFAVIGGAYRRRCARRGRHRRLPRRCQGRRRLGAALSHAGRAGRGGGDVRQCRGRRRRRLRRSRGRAFSCPPRRRCGDRRALR